MANLRIYEILYIIDPTLNEAETDAVHNKVKETITSAGGSVRREEKWGKRHLAYEVGKFREGFYAFIEFNADGEIVKAMKDMLHLEGRVIRYLITAVPKAKMEEEKRKARETARGRNWPRRRPRRNWPRWNRPRRKSWRPRRAPVKNSQWIQATTRK
jgi:small subunit ribosomal protein S6